MKQSLYEVWFVAEGIANPKPLAVLVPEEPIALDGDKAAQDQAQATSHSTEQRKAFALVESVITPDASTGAITRFEPGQVKQLAKGVYCKLCAFVDDFAIPEGAPTWNGEAVQSGPTSVKREVVCSGCVARITESATTTAAAAAGEQQ